jgi:hypothetical protein
LTKTIFKNFPDIYTHLGTNLHYIPILISKSAHPTVYRQCLLNTPHVLLIFDTGGLAGFQEGIASLLPPDIPLILATGAGFHALSDMRKLFLMTQLKNFFQLNLFQLNKKTQKPHTFFGLGKIQSSVLSYLQ